MSEDLQLRPMRFCYADPPYPGQAWRVYGKHKDYAGEVDHAELIERLMADFPDGWALSTSASALPEVLALCPYKRGTDKKNPGRVEPESSVRVMAWVKPMSAFFKGVSVQYSWEPVILWRGRNRAGQRYAVRDSCIASPHGYSWRATPEGHVTGAKPQAFCYWLFDCLGAMPGDTLDDLFTGSGAVARAWKSYMAQPVLPYVDPREDEPLFKEEVA